MRTAQTFLSLPVAVIVYIATGMICNVLPYLMDLVSSINSMRGMEQGFSTVEFVFNWIVLFLAYSILPILASNFVMNLMLKKEDRYWMSLLPKVMLATLGVLFFSISIFISITMGTATKVIIAGYMLSIVSSVIVPFVLDAYTE